MKFAFVTNYNGQCDWIPRYADKYIVYDRTNCGLKYRIVRKNIGDADYDKLTFLVENYDNLPEVFLFTKSNLFKFITPEEFEEVKDNTEFTPLLTKNHKTYEPICRYEDGMYAEINNSWYLGSVPSKYFKNYGEFAQAFGLPNPEYLKFAPGGSYILTRERVHRKPKEFYEALQSLLPWSQRPGEAQMIERSYYNIWS